MGGTIGMRHLPQGRPVRPIHPPLLPTLLVLAVAGIARAEDPDPNLPAQAETLLSTSAETEGHLQSDYLQKLIDEQTRLLAQLDKLCKSLARDGNLDGALAVKKRMALISTTVHDEKNTLAFAHLGADDIEKFLMSTTFMFHYPGGSRALRFGPHGTFNEGANDNENSWRLNGQKLELINSNHAVFSRWNCDPTTGDWTNERFGDVICTEELTLEAEKTDDSKN
jgi:hypothetical protein